jgi:hypothetical protein
VVVAGRIVRPELALRCYGVRVPIKGMGHAPSSNGPGDEVAWDLGDGRPRRGRRTVTYMSSWRPASVEYRDLTRELRLRLDDPRDRLDVRPLGQWIEAQTPRWRAVRRESTSWAASARSCAAR